MEEVETKLSVKESEIVELKNLLHKAHLLWIKLHNKEDKNAKDSQTTVLNDPNALIASLRKRRADRVKDQAFAPPSTYMWSRPPP